MHYNIEEKIIDEIIAYQKLAIVDPRVVYPVQESFLYNIHDVIYNKTNLKEFKNTIEFTGKSYLGDFFEYGKETLWWGRRVPACKTRVKVI